MNNGLSLHYMFLPRIPSTMLRPFTIVVQGILFRNDDGKTNTGTRTKLVTNYEIAWFPSEQIRMLYSP